jgi:tagatose-1,6-bisphosphate aldolase
VVLARALAPHRSGILVDGYYGHWNSIASFPIPSATGVLIRVEKSGGEKNRHGAPLGAVEPGWGVDKIKRCGAEAVKLLTPIEPNEFDSAEHQFAFPADLRRVPEARRPAAPGADRLSVRRRKEGRPEVQGPQGRDGD